MSGEEVNLDIDAYSTNDLLKVLNLTRDYNDVTLDQAFQYKKSLIEKSKADPDSKRRYDAFLRKAYFKLLRALKVENFGHTFTNENLHNTTQKIQLHQDRYEILQQPNLIQHDDHFIIQPNLQTQQEVFNNPVPKGTLNPIRRRIMKHVFSIDTQFRSNYEKTNNSDFIYILPAPVRNVISMKLSNVEMPNTWYQVNKYNNTFYIKFNRPSTNSGPTDLRLSDYEIIEDREIKIEVPVGNWSNGLLNPQMRAFFDNNTQGLRCLHFNINDVDGKTYIRYKTPTELTAMNNTYGSAYPTSFDNDFEMVITMYVKDEDRNTRRSGYVDPKDDFLTTMGFKNDYYSIGFTNTHTLWGVNYNGCLISDTIFGQNKISYFFICMNDYVNSHKDTIIFGYDKEHFLSKDIIAKIQVKFGSFMVNIDDAGDNIYKKREYFGPVNIERLHIQLIDKYGQHIDLNGCDYSFSLEFEQVYS